MKLDLKVYIVGLILIGLIVAGCGQQKEALKPAPNSGNEVNASVTVTDSIGRTVTIKQPVERVAILDRGTADVLRALGVTDKLVGIHQSMINDSFWPEVQGIPAVATWSEVSYETLAEVRPQVVFSSTNSHGIVGEQEHLQGFDIQDIKISLRFPDRMRTEVKMLGEIFSKQKEAQALIDFYDKHQNFINSRLEQVKPEDRRKVYLEYHGGAFKTGGTDSFVYQQVELAGGINLSSSLTGLPEVSAEWVAESNPDVIIREAATGVFGYVIESGEEANKLRQEILERPGLNKTAAVQNGEVYLLGTDVYSRPAYIVGVSYLAKWFYPDLFADFDPEDVLKEYFETFHPGLDYKGVFTYPR